MAPVALFWNRPTLVRCATASPQLGSSRWHSLEVCLWWLPVQDLLSRTQSRSQLPAGTELRCRPLTVDSNVPRLL